MGHDAGTHNLATPTPSVVGAVLASSAAATPRVSCLPKIVTMLPGATLTSDNEAALTIRKS